MVFASSLHFSILLKLDKKMEIYSFISSMNKDVENDLARMSHHLTKV